MIHYQNVRIFFCSTLMRILQCITTELLISILEYLNTAELLLSIITAILNYCLLGYECSYLLPEPRDREYLLLTCKDFAPPPVSSKKIVSKSSLIRNGACNRASTLDAHFPLNRQVRKWLIFYTSTALQLRQVKSKEC